MKKELSKGLATWSRESATLVDGKSPVLIGFSTAVMLDGVETIISAPTMAALEKVYDEILRLDDDGVMEAFNPDLCTHVAYLPRAAISVDMDL